MSCATPHRFGNWPACRTRRTAALAVLLLTWATSGHAAAEVDTADLRAVSEAFDDWQFEDGRARLARLILAEPDDPRVTFLQGELAFYDGEYDKALGYLDQAITNAPDSHKANYEAFRALVNDTATVNRDHVTVLSPDGRFQIRYPKGKDEVLAELAFDGLSAAYDAFAQDFGVRPPIPVRVEVYDSAADLARVSSLTEEDIATSGTIALCKYNRLMLTSPKALVRGYTWLDTLVHEYAHLVINVGGKGRVPIWLHEGLAKFSERRWRGGDEVRRLPPYSEWLLHKRSSDGDIVTFQQMHPSMAKLPSQEDAAMAFAEVYAAMELVHARRGVEGLRSLVSLMGEGSTVEDAVATVVGDTWDAFLRRWEKHLVTRTRKYTGTEPPDIFDQVAFKKNVSVGDPDDIEEIPEEQAKRWVHLGDKLYTKGRVAASVVEYRKAAGTIGDTNPVLQARLGRALIDVGEVDEAIGAMKKAIDDGETYVTLYVYLGEALVRAERWNEAYEALREAAAINPFDPSVHRNLARVYRHQGLTEQAESAERHARLVVSSKASAADAKERPHP